MTATTTTAPDALRVPVAILTADDILQDAAAELARNERMRAALRASDDRLRRICRQYDQAAGVWGFQPHHLRRACEARGLLP